MRRKCYWQKLLKDTNRKIRTTFFIDYCVWILVPNSLQDMHSAFWTRLTSPQTSPAVFSLLLLEPFLEPHMYMNSVFLIFLLVSLLTTSICKRRHCRELLCDFSSLNAFYSFSYFCSLQCCWKKKSHDVQKRGKRFHFHAGKLGWIHFN